jgi:hypothetical protein
MTYAIDQENGEAFYYPKVYFVDYRLKTQKTRVMRVLTIISYPTSAFIAIHDRTFD